uniref:Thiol:disulfide interchange protein DsbD n=1 Tax=Candidatus Methanogaster sp. ANME-2c ERB4 TaxID=2759911 RepID=A0A7G9YMG5_9EURY|nr:thiol:disulfide interchange protein DsbD [Methanosarcinales archaeon ANME-2c ERB4]
MKKRGMLALIVLVALVACLMSACIDSTTPSQPSEPETPGTGITWYSYDEGMKIAQEQNKPVMIDIYTGWCKWCKELDRVIYTDSDVINLADKFVCIKFNADKHRDLAAKYNPTGGVPTIVFLRSDGTETHRLGGYPRGGAEAFMHEMVVALNNA